MPTNNIDDTLKDLKKSYDRMFFAFITLLGIYIVTVLSFSIELRGIKQEAINNNFAEYNSTNGNWQWKMNQK